MNDLLAVILAVLVSAFLPLATQAYDFQSCVDCHEETLNSDNNRYYLHSPYKQQQCGECHAAVLTTQKSQEVAVKAPTAILKNRQKTEWLGDSVTVDTSHWFLLPDDKAGHTLVAEMHGTNGAVSREEIIVPVLAYLPEVEDNGRQPAISKVQVLNVQRGVFLSATIGWQTDTLTYALVRYGDKDLSQTSEPGKRLGLQHQVVLNNLQLDKMYHFTTVSRNLFGRSQISEPLTFSTSKPFTVTPPDKPDHLTKNAGKAGIISAFQRIGSDYLLELSLAQPAAVYLGSKGVILGQALTAASTAAMGGDNEFHAGLSSEAVVSLHSCQNCHENQSTATHPVNVLPKPGMTIPQEYPTLADGRITCRSCHTSHGSDHEFLTRKSNRRELCVGCHKDML